MIVRYTHSFLSPPSMACFLCLSLLVLGLSSAGLNAQGPVEECMQVIQKTYRTLGNPPGNDSSYHIKYDFQVRSGDIVLPNSSMHIDMIVNAHKLHFITDKMKVYRDTIYTVSIVPEQRIVRVVGIGMKDVETQQASSLEFMHDSLFRSFNAQSCTKVPGGSDQQYRLVGTLDSSLTTMSGVDSLAFVVDLHTKSLSSVHLIQSQPVPMVTELVFDTIDWSYHSDAFDMSVLDVVLKGNGDLLPEYHGYRLIDLRK